MADLQWFADRARELYRSEGDESVIRWEVRRILEAFDEAIEGVDGEGNGTM